MTIPQRLRDAGCTDISTHTLHRYEMIYVQDQKYYPTICNGYKDAACCTSLQEAQQWIENIKNAPSH